VNVKVQTMNILRVNNLREFATRARFWRAVDLRAWNQNGGAGEAAVAQTAQGVVVRYLYPHAVSLAPGFVSESARNPQRLVCPVTAENIKVDFAHTDGSGKREA